MLRWRLRRPTQNLLDLRLKKMGQVVHSKLDVSKDGSQQSGADCLAGMNGYCCCSAVGMFQERVAAACSFQGKSGFLKGPHKLPTLTRGCRVIPILAGCQQVQASPFRA